MEEQNKSNSKMQLLIIEPNENLEYYNVSKIGFHKFDDELCVVPTENKSEYIPIAFKRSIIHQTAFQRIICIDECESDSNKYLLIFSTVEKCIRFIESIKHNKKVKDKLLITASSDDEIFKIKYLAPVIKIASKNSLLEELLKSVLSEILEYYKPSAKTETNILQNENVTKDTDNKSTNSVNQDQTRKVDENLTIQSSANSNQSIVDSKERTINLRKRPNNISYQDVENEEDYGRKTLKRKYSTKKSEPKLQKMPTLDNIIYAPNFIKYVRNGISMSKLFIFPSSDTEFCYQYYYSSQDKKYVCSGCLQKQNGRKYVSAIIEKDSNGTDYVKCLQTNHLCNAQKFQPENYQSDLIIKKPNYQFVENLFRGKIIKYLLLFTSADKKKYYKFTYIHDKNIYLCNKCSKTFRRYISAHINYDGNGDEFIYVRNLKHACSNGMEYLKAEEATTTITSELADYQVTKESEKNENNESRSQHSIIPQTPQNIFESKIIKKPYFQLFQRNFQGREIKKLAIFDSNDSTMCYELTWKNDKQYYICHPCKNYYRKHVTATIINNGNEEEEHIQMGNFDHKCKLQKFEL